MAKRQYNKTVLPKLLSVTSVLLVSVAVILFIQQGITDHHVNEAAQKAISLANKGRPSPAPATIKPSHVAVKSYTVPADHPRYLKIPELNIEARIMAVGLTKDHAIGTPSDVYDTAWYDQSSLPGQPGVTLIDGHVSSWTTDGVFYHLNLLTAGDKITIQLGDNTSLNYTVVKTQIYSNNDVDMNALLSPITQGVSGLNLITCDGKVIKGTNEFNQRVVVYAKLSA
jgi:LPXTG-site transpeptidase (sortase) family protein